MEDDLDLRYYAAVLWRRRYVIGMVTLVAVLAAGLFSFLSPPVYEAEALLLVRKSSLQVGTLDPREPGPKISSVLSSELASETVVAFAKSLAILTKVTAEVPDAVAREKRFLRRADAQAVRGTDLVELRVRGRTPARITTEVNAWADLVTAESEALFSSEASLSLAFFSTRVNDAKAGLDQAEEALRRFNASSQIGVLFARVKAITEQIATYETRANDVSVSLQRSEIELAQTIAELRRHPRTLTLSKSIADDPFLHQTAAQASGRDFVDLSKVQLKSQELNPVYTTLEQTRADSAVRVAALRAERDKLARIMTQMNGELADMLQQAAEQQLTQAQVTRTVDNTKQLYGVLLQRREEASVAATSRGGSVKVAAAAVGPEFPVGPRKALNVALGFVLGLITGTMLAVGLEYFAVQHSDVPQRRAAVVASGSRAPGVKPT